MYSTKESKEAAILDKVRELMFRNGIKNLTMDDISKHLGISKKTLYQVVDNKADLVGKVIDFTLREHKHGIQCILQEFENPIEELLHIYRQTNALSGSMHYGLTFEIRKYYPESWEKLEKFRAEYIYQNVCANLKKGIGLGLYRKDINVPIVAKLYAARTLDVYNPDIFPPAEFSSNIILREMFIYHIRGIASPSGLAFLESEIKMEL